MIEIISFGWSYMEHKSLFFRILNIKQMISFFLIRGFIEFITLKITEIANKNMLWFLKK